MHMILKSTGSGTRYKAKEGDLESKWCRSRYDALRAIAKEVRKHGSREVPETKCAPTGD